MCVLLPHNQVVVVLLFLLKVAVIPYGDESLP